MEGTMYKLTCEGYFEGHSNEITALNFHSNANQLVSSSLDKTIMLWQLKHWKSAYKFLGHIEGVLDVCYSLKGDLLASASADKSVGIWVPKIKGYSQKFQAHSAAVRSVQFSPSGEQLATASNDKSVKLWLTCQTKFLKAFNGHTNWVRCAKFSPDGKLLVSCCDDKTIKVWDIISGKCVKTFKELKAFARYVEFHPNGITIGAAYNDCNVKLYDLRTNSLCQRYIHDGPVSMIKFHPMGNFLLSASFDSKMKILDILEGRSIYTLEGHCAGITAITFSRDGKLFASASLDQRILIWKSNACMDGQIKKIPTRLTSSTIKQEFDNMNKESNSDECEKNVHEKQAQEKDLSNKSKELHQNLESDKNPYKESAKKPNMSNIESSEKDSATNVQQDQTKLLNATLFDEFFKTIEALCDHTQSLYHVVNALEQRLIKLEKTLSKQTSSEKTVSS